MKKIYIIVKNIDGVLKVVAEFDEISQCNEYLKDANYRVLNAWKKDE